MITIYEELQADIRTNFTIEKELKSSERGTVWLVWSRRAKARYICRAFTGSSEVYRKLLGADCPYLPRIEAAAERDGHVLVLEEYIQGDTLASILSGGPLPAPQARAIAAQLCRALEALHALGIVHRDIKPENVILRGDEAVLIDFDTSRLSKPERSADTQAMGTAGYAAPEQYGFAQTDARADIYALGVLLNEMLTRQHPSRALTAGPLLPVIEKCIEVNVDRRYASVAELRAALEAVPDRAADSGRSRRTARLAAGIAAVLLLAGCALYGIPRLRAGQTAEEPPHIEAGAAESGQPSAEADPPVQVSSLPVEDRVWTQHPQGYTTPFAYDLDGDGTAEDYIFGITFNSSSLYGLVIPGERMGLSESDVKIRDPIPCVWRSQPDGSFEVVEEFAALLTGAEVTLWRVSNLDAPMPEHRVLDGAVWPGGVNMVFTHDHLGTWMIQATAALGELELTAVTNSEYVDISEF